MKIAIGADHRGYEMKKDLAALLRKLGHEVVDVGTESAESVDYPLFAEKVAREVAEGRAGRGVLLCMTGIGMAVAANKVPGARAAVCHDVESAEFSRKHNDVNVLCIGRKFVTPELAREIVDLWMRTEFEGGRHARRVDQIRRMDGSASSSGA